MSERENYEQMATEAIHEWQSETNGSGRHLHRLVADAIEKAAVEARTCPGVWVCDKCGFTQFKNILHTQNGAISVDRRPNLEPCPNDGRDMRPVTWKERCDDVANVCESQVKRAVELEEKLHACQASLNEVSRFMTSKEQSDAAEIERLKADLARAKNQSEAFRIQLNEAVGNLERLQ